ncbi:hypothetical protein BDD12DRAFT_273051 [Trichophaea hybrida]|nr:hypothetical protein BDD12DRAFT_273051 [Trichophaea hybrida]
MQTVWLIGTVNCSAAYCSLLATRCNSCFWFHKQLILQCPLPLNSRKLVYRPVQEFVGGKICLGNLEEQYGRPNKRERGLLFCCNFQKQYYDRGRPNIEAT